MVNILHSCKLVLMYICLTREKQIRAIEESFEAAKLPPVHQTKRGIEAEWVLPLFPYFERYTYYINFLFTGSKNLSVMLLCTR